MFIREIVRLHGYAKNIVSDRDENFTFKIWKEIFVGLGIDLAFNTNYHLQTNGEIERADKIVGDMLRMYMMHHQR